MNIFPSGQPQGFPGSGQPPNLSNIKNPNMIPLIPRQAMPPHLQLPTTSLLNPQQNHHPRNRLASPMVLHGNNHHNNNQQPLLQHPNQVQVPLQVPNILPQTQVPNAASTASHVSPFMMGHQADKLKLHLLQFVDADVKTRASEWIEYKTPEGKPYYFSVKTQQSVWDKPKPLQDLDG